MAMKGKIEPSHLFEKRGMPCGMPLLNTGVVLILLVHIRLREQLDHGLFLCSGRASGNLACKSIHPRLEKQFGVLFRLTRRLLAIIVDIELAELDDVHIVHDALICIERGARSIICPPLHSPGIATALAARHIEVLI